MKKLFSLFAVAVLIAILMHPTYSQNVNVSGALVGNGTYATLAAAFTAINGGSQTGANIVITIDNNTVETATATLNTGSWASLNISPTGIYSISGSIVGAIVRLNGADNVTIDGRISGSGRNLTVQNTNTSTLTAAIWMSSVGAGAGCLNNTIRNLEILCGTNPVTSANNTFGIIMCGATISLTSNGDDNDNNTFTENRIIKCRYGIVTRGVTTNNNQNIIVSGNIIGPTSFGTDEIGKVGIFMQADNNSQVINNTVQYVGGTLANTSAGADRVGIAIGQESWSATTTSTLTSGNYTVSGNIIHDIVEERTFSAVGILIGTTLGGPKTNNLISNNIIYNVRSNGTSSDQGAGIGHCGGPGDRIVFNSILMSGDVDPAGTSPSSSNPSNIGISKHLSSAPDTSVTIKNNIVSMDLNSNTATLLFLCIQTPTSPYSWGSGGMNNNLYYFPPANTQMRTGGTGTGITPVFTTLANWQTAYSPSHDLASINTNPPFISSTNLHIDPFVSTGIESGGTPITGVSTDFDGDSRNASTPDIGADEGNFTPLAGMTYSSSTVTQNNTGNLGQGSTNNEIIGIRVVTTGSTSPLAITSLDLNTNGSSNPAGDITNAKVWYTGTSSTFAATTQFGSTFSGPNGSFTVAGSQTLAEGINYFWVTYDISGSAAPGNVVDAECNSITGSGTMGLQVPGIQAPSGNRMIAGPLSGTYTVGLSMMRVLTGKNLQYVTKTRLVKQSLITGSSQSAKDEIKNNSPAKLVTNTIDQKADLTNYSITETFIEETYSEITENGAVYSGELYVPYTRNNKDQGDNNDLLGNYATITAALNDLNSRGVSGAVTFLLIDANYPGETYPLQINYNISGVNAANTITIKPQTGVSTTIPGSISSNASLRILSSYVTIDGSNSNSTDRSLTIQNNSATSPNAILIGSTGTTPVTNVVIKNCSIRNGANTSSAIVIGDNSTIGGAGYYNTITIQNNLIERAFIGVYANGGSTTANGFNLTCSDNTLTSSGSNSIRLVGLYAQYTNGVTISNNSISNIANTSDAANNIGGIWTASGTSNVTISGNNISTISSTLNSSSYIDFGILVANGLTGSNCNISGNTINGITASGSATATGIIISSATSGITIQKNKISNIKNTNTVGWGANGIYLASTSLSGDVTVKNNMIFDIAAYGYASGTSATDNGYGIIITSGSNHRIYNNSIHLNTNQTVNGLPSAINITSGVTTAAGTDIRNNLFVNSQTMGTNRYAFYSGAASTVYSDINYNSYYSSGPNIGNIGTTDRAAVSDLRAGTGKDVQSFSRLPLFNSSTDLHIQPADLSVSGRGNFIAGNNDDYDGDPRPVSQSISVKPVDVGCDQYSVSAFATGNVCALSGNTFFDGGLRAIEITGGTCTTGQVRQFTGVKTPNNTMLKMINPVKNNETIKNKNQKGNSNPVIKTKKDGTSGGTTDAMAVNTPWVYWEIDNLAPTSEPLTLRFYYNDDQMATILESDLKLSYWSGSEWLNYFAQSVDAVNNFIEVTLPIGQSWPSTSLFAIEDQNSPLPVVLSSFDLSVDKRDIALSWTTESEINNKGFAVERRIKTQNGQYSVWKEITFVNGNGNSNSSINYSYTDKKLISGAYQYRLKQIDYNGNYEFHAPAINSDLIIGKPGAFDISQNYPNPSNPNSKIDFSMPFDGKVTIKVYDILGKEVASLMNEFKPADFYTVEFDGTNIASGTYFYRIIAEGDNQKFTKTLKMILVK